MLVFNYIILFVILISLGILYQKFLEKQSKTASFGSNQLSVSGEKNTEIHFNVNTAMTWCNSGSCAAVNSIMMPSALSLQMATDFNNGFVFDKIVE
jgi:hypothetical protein